MRKLLHYLFTDEVKTYSYNVSKEAVVDKITLTLTRSGKLLTEPDFKGYFTSSDDFEMSVNSGAVTTGNAKFGSILYGKVISTGNNQTTIKTSIKARFPLKMIAIATPLLGFGYLYKSINETSLQYFLLAVGMLILVPIICNRFAGIFNSVIKERFEIHINQELRKMNISSNGLQS